ncbi:MAG: DUF4093 domain-containing protein [Eubacteriales bacterium]
MEKIIIQEGIVVEGKYDKNTLSQVVDALILKTDGFGIFQNPTQMKLLEKIAQKQGLIVFTDGDSAGFLIRNKIKSCIDKRYLKHAFPPDISGKERRKDKKSKEGILGVEGMTPEIIVDCLKKSGATIAGESRNKISSDFTMADFLGWGLTGVDGCVERRARLISRLYLPNRVTNKGLLEILNHCYEREEIEKMIKIDCNFEI